MLFTISLENSTLMSDFCISQSINKKNFISFYFSSFVIETSLKFFFPRCGLRKKQIQRDTCNETVFFLLPKCAFLFDGFIINFFIAFKKIGKNKRRTRPGFVCFVLSCRCKLIWIANIFLFSCEFVFFFYGLQRFSKSKQIEKKNW